MCRAGIVTIMDPSFLQMVSPTLLTQEWMGEFDPLMNKLIGGPHIALFVDGCGVCHFWKVLRGC